ncbi:MAG: prephenate dehydrogenase, partial [Actinomycetes bacterium]
MPDAPPVRPDSAARAQIVGTGLIGASIGLALRRRGWWVTGSDRDGRRSDAAHALGAVDAVGRDADPAITFIATPAGSVVAEARRALEGPGAVTDVAGVKAPMAEGIIHPRFVGGHPMAGSEQVGAEGADADLFVGATWVLCPTESTEAAAYTTVQSAVSSLGANVVALAAKQHDDVVALVSHVPHLTAATLMNLAADSAVDERTLLRLAAGGFRDMTRIAAGHPGIWPDICV